MTTLKARKTLGKVHAYVAGKPIEEVQRELGLERIIKLASNENPYGCSPAAKEVMLLEMEQAHFYPETTAPALVKKLSEKLQVEKEKIFIGNGSDEIIRLLTRSFIDTNDEVIIPDVTFPRYETNTLIEGGTPVLVPLVNGVHDLQSMYNAITDKTKIIVVCNPNNPTGTIVSKKELTDFINKVPKHIMLVIDEAYYEYVNDEEYLETIPFLQTNSNLVILRTFSKIYGLASLRIGYGMMHPSIIEELLKVKDAFNTNRIAQAAALASLEDEAFVKDCAVQNEKCRNYLETELTKMGLDYFQSHANFLMIKLKQHGKEIFEGLLKQGIIVRSGHLLGYDHTIRVSIGSQHENEEFIKSLQKLIG